MYAVCRMTLLNFQTDYQTKMLTFTGLSLSHMVSERQVSILISDVIIWI